jgi:hypothetical protein
VHWLTNDARDERFIDNLERDPSLGRKHAVYDEMRAKGQTDHVAWSLYHTLGPSPNYWGERCCCPAPWKRPEPGQHW